VEGYPQDKAGVAVDEIYAMLNEEAEQLGIEDIPVKVEIVDPDGLKLDVRVDPTGGAAVSAALAEPADTTAYHGAESAFSLFYNPVLLMCGLGAVIVLLVGYFLVRRSRGKDAP